MGKLKLKEVPEKVDATARLNKEVKTKTITLKIWKGELREFAEANDTFILEGSKSDANFSASSKKAECSPQELLEVLRNLDMEHLFYSLLDVKVGEVRKLLGDIIADDLISVEKNAWGKVTFKIKK